MVGRRFLGQVDKYLCQVFHRQADTLFGACSYLLFVDFGHLPQVMDRPLCTTAVYAKTTGSPFTLRTFSISRARLYCVYGS